MRKLKAPDIFNCARVIKASGIREELVDYLQKISEQDDLNTERVGINTILMIIEALSEKKAEHAIYEFLAPIFEMSVSEVEEMPLPEFLASLKQLAEENDLPNFLGSVSGILGKN